MKTVSTCCWVVSAITRKGTLVDDEIVGVALDIPLSDAGEEEASHGILIAHHCYEFISLALADIALHGY